MIPRSLGFRSEFLFVIREARRSSQTMAADRSTLSRRSILFLFVLLGIPNAARAATLEDSAKELARKIAAALPARENVSCDIRNASSLRHGEVGRIDAALKTELQEQGVRLAGSGATTTVFVTLSENFEKLVWTGEIRQGETSHTVFIAAERSPEDRASSGVMPLTIRGEKFWEGPERILDAGEVSNGAGKVWLVLLLPGGLRIQDRQTGSSSAIEITSNQSASRDPWGNLNFGQTGNTIAFFLSPRVCTVNLEMRNLDGCLPADGSTEAPLASRFPVMFDVAPPGPPPPGRGTAIEMKSVCGGAGRFLATGDRDYTQTDSLQVFQTEGTGASAIGAELDFPGPITALHGVSDTARAVVRNITTGNYEAYRLSFSCGQ